MTITAANRNSIRSPVFVSAQGFDTDVEADNLSVYLRPYDVQFLQSLLARYEMIVGRVHTYNRPQGLAARLLWWRDRDNVLGPGLLALCANTAHLDPFARQPNPAHPNWGRVSNGGEALGPTPAEEHLAQVQRAAKRLVGRRPWLKTLAITTAYLLTEAAEEFVPPFPFGERDGSRWEPLEDLTEGNYTPKANVWMPLCVRERLAECGANFREQGRDGVNDPLGRFDKLNRSAAVRRLIEGMRRKPRPLAPLNFRGIELSHRPVTSDEWKIAQSHYFDAHIQIAEANLRRRRAADEAAGPAAYQAASTERDRAIEALTNRVTAVKAWAGRIALPAGVDQDEFIATHTGFTKPEEKVAAVVVPEDTTGETQAASVEQPKAKRNKTRAPRKVRAATIDKPFNADELG